MSKNPERQSARTHGLEISWVLLKNLDSPSMQQPEAYFPAYGLPCDACLLMNVEKSRGLALTWTHKPSAVSSAIVASSSDWLRAHVKTRAPKRPNSRTTDFPIPLEPPVTSTHFPRNPIVAAAWAATATADGRARLLAILTCRRQTLFMVTWVVFSRNRSHESFQLNAMMVQVCKKNVHEHAERSDSANNRVWCSAVWTTQCGVPEKVIHNSMTWDDMKSNCTLLRKRICEKL